jgi:hypothetical protein
LAFLALACNAAVPIVLAFLLVAALGPTRHEWVRLADGEWLYYGPSCRHGGSAAPEHGKSRGAPCPVCSLHGTLALAPPVPAAGPTDPVPADLAVAPVAATAEPAAVFFVGYRSRAPPTG